jgi:hypothetical protein
MIKLQRRKTIFESCAEDVFLRLYTSPQNRATIVVRFYVMTQTSLSAATRVQRDESARSGFPPHASSFQKPRPPWPVRRGGRLIANLESKSHLSHRKRSPLRILNCKFRGFCARRGVLMRLSSAALVCCSLAPLNGTIRCAGSGLHATHHPSIGTIFLIHGTAIKTPRNPFKNSNLIISNRQQSAYSDCGITRSARSADGRSDPTHLPATWEAPERIRRVNRIL